MNITYTQYIHTWLKSQALSQPLHTGSQGHLNHCVIQAPHTKCLSFGPSNKDIVKGCPTAYRVQVPGHLPLDYIHGYTFVYRSLLVCYAITVSIRAKRETNMKKPTAQMYNEFILKLMSYFVILFFDDNTIKVVFGIG